MMMKTNRTKTSHCIFTARVELNFAVDSIKREAMSPGQQHYALAQFLLLEEEIKSLREELQKLSCLDSQKFEMENA